MKNNTTSSDSSDINYTITDSSRYSTTNINYPQGTTNITDNEEDLKTLLNEIYTNMNNTEKPICKKEYLKSRIEVAKELIKECEETIEKIDKLSLKEGDAAFHKEYGNVLIKEIKVSGQFTEKVELIGYEIVTKTGSIDVVKTKDLVPLGELTDVLYKK